MYKMCEINRSNDISNTMQEAQKLLISWQLPQLCQKFKDEEVCILAFPCLSSEDIKQLIPKVGPRAIFNVRLKEWLSKQNFTTDNVIKTEETMATEEMCILSKTTIENDAINEEEYDSLEIMNENSTLYEADMEEDTSLVDIKSNSTKFSNTLNESSNLSLPCRETHTHNWTPIAKLLENNVDGRVALCYYEKHGLLDATQRKNIVNLIIQMIISKRIQMHASCFHNITEQLIEIMPNEKYEMYYVRRRGQVSPRGAIYNKYINLSRRSRKEGVLEYLRRRKPNTY